MLVGQIRLAGRRATILTPGGTCEVTAPNGCLAALIDLVDGIRSVDEVVASLAVNWDRHCVRELIRVLFDQGALVDCREVIMAYWRYVQNPPTLAAGPMVHDGTALIDEVVHAATVRERTTYRRALPPLLGKLLEQRASAAAFQPGALTPEDLTSLLGAAYAFQPHRTGAHRTVPSAGALSPLTLLVHMPASSPGLAAGTYRAHYRVDGSVGLVSISGDTRAFAACFADLDVLRFAHAVIVITADVSRCARKYGNRALLYVCLEAGHALQNAQLAAAELRIGAREIGAFAEGKLQQALGLPDALMPLAVLAVGRPAAPVNLGPPRRFRGEWVDSSVTTHPLPFHLRMIELVDPELDMDACWGRDVNPFVADDKARAEAFERLAVTLPVGLRRARLCELRGAVDPRHVVRYAHVESANALRRPDRFGDKTLWWWKMARDHWTGRRAWLVADQVYFGKDLRRQLSSKPFYLATTSGVACYPTFEGALERAVLELIERDAFMRAWVQRSLLPDVAPARITAHQRERLRTLRGLGYRVATKRLPSAYAQCALVFCQSALHGWTVVGTAAAYSLDHAVEQAMMEVEAVVLVAGEQMPAPARGFLPKHVKTPVDHRELYRCRRYFRRADRLGEPWHTAEADRQGVTPKDWAGLQARLVETGLPLYTVDLTPSDATLHGGRCPLSVVRAIVPGMVSMAFGYGEQPVVELRGRNTRQSASRIAFPHPFA
jgi:ribosomal protein S12 methylthiotransferase accessory factor